MYKRLKAMRSQHVPFVGDEVIHSTRKILYQKGLSQQVGDLDLLRLLVREGLRFFIQTDKHVQRWLAHHDELNDDFIEALNGYIDDAFAVNGCLSTPQRWEKILFHKPDRETRYNNWSVMKVLRLMYRVRLRHTVKGRSQRLVFRKVRKVLSCSTALACVSRDARLIRRSMGFDVEGLVQLPEYPHLRANWKLDNQNEDKRITYRPFPRKPKQASHLRVESWLWRHLVWAMTRKRLEFNLWNHLFPSFDDKVHYGLQPQGDKVDTDPSGGIDPPVLAKCFLDGLDKPTTERIPLKVFKLTHVEGIKKRADVAQKLNITLDAVSRAKKKIEEVLVNTMKIHGYDMLPAGFMQEVKQQLSQRLP
jgi:hypothetical protein